jgi:hypothetical protein
MAASLRALLLALALLAVTGGAAGAIQDSEERPLPFTAAKCRVLIERGAPFQLGGPDTNEACIIIIGGAPTR